ncbi:MAG TPA: DUF1844 domain-containing protein [Balneolales bacterium]|nr:DUF1844 domain-containing protein [Balneolales bacterium]
MSNSATQEGSLNPDAKNLNEDQQFQLLFMMLVQQHEQIGMMGLGKQKNPATDKIEKDLSSAKYAIDTLRMLQKYTEGNLSRELKGYLTQVLSTLQLNYVDESNKKESGSSEEKKDKE